MQQQQAHTGLNTFQYRTDKWWETRSSSSSSSSSSVTEEGAEGSPDDRVNSGSAMVGSQRTGTSIQNLYFAYLMVNRCQNIKTTTQVGKDRKPKRKVERYNNGQVKTVKNRSIKSAQGHWILEMVLGPFERDLAMKVRAEWKNKCRGIPRRRERGIELATRYGVSCWDAEIDRKSDDACLSGGSSGGSSNNVAEQCVASSSRGRGRGRGGGKRGTRSLSATSHRKQHKTAEATPPRSRASPPSYYHHHHTQEDDDAPEEEEEEDNNVQEAGIGGAEDEEDECQVFIGCSPTGNPREHDGNDENSF